VIYYYVNYLEDVGQELRIRMLEWVPIILSTSVIAAAIVGRFFWGRIVAFWKRIQDLFLEKLGESIGQPLFLAFTLLVSVGAAWLFLWFIIWIMWKSLG